MHFSSLTQWQTALVLQDNAVWLDSLPSPLSRWGLMWGREKVNRQGPSHQGSFTLISPVPTWSTASWIHRCEMAFVLQIWLKPTPPFRLVEGGPQPQRKQPGVAARHVGKWLSGVLLALSYIPLPRRAECPLPLRRRTQHCLPQTSPASRALGSWADHENKQTVLGPPPPSVSLHSSDCPWTHRNLLASASPALGFKESATMPSWNFSFRHLMPLRNFLPK